LQHEQSDIPIPNAIVVILPAEHLAAADRERRREEYA
jgi:hypothetical protein